MTRALLLALLVAGCSGSPASVNPCPGADSIYGCDPLPPPVVDSLLPLPDSSEVP